ncbi:unnamed protein product, partial [Polarella glacialis]
MSPNNGDVDGTIYWSKLAVSLREKCLLQQHSGAAQPGRLLGVLGPSGAGKSTLLAALAGTLQTRLKIEGNVWSTAALPQNILDSAWPPSGRRSSTRTFEFLASTLGLGRGLFTLVIARDWGLLMPAASPEDLLFDTSTWPQVGPNSEKAVDRLLPCCAQRPRSTQRYSDRMEVICAVVLPVALKLLGRCDRELEKFARLAWPCVFHGMPSLPRLLRDIGGEGARAQLVAACRARAQGTGTLLAEVFADVVRETVMKRWPAAVVALEEAVAWVAGVSPVAMKDDAVAVTRVVIVTVVAAAVAAVDRGRRRPVAASIAAGTCANPCARRGCVARFACSLLVACHADGRHLAARGNWWMALELPFLSWQPPNTCTAASRLAAMASPDADREPAAPEHERRLGGSTAASLGKVPAAGPADGKCVKQPALIAFSIPIACFPCRSRAGNCRAYEPGASLLREIAATENDVAKTSSRTDRTFWYHPVTKASSYEMPPDVAQRVELQQRLVRRRATLDSMTGDLGPNTGQTSRDNLPALPAKGAPGLTSVEAASPRAGLLRYIDALEREIADTTSPYTQPLGRKLELQTRLQALKTELQKAQAAQGRWQTQGPNLWRLVGQEPRSDATLPKQYSGATRTCSALEVWGVKASKISSHWQTGVEVKFMAGISTAAQLHRHLEAMGVHILDSADGEALAGQPLPFGAPKGQRAQPAVEGTFAMAPKVTAMTVQVHTRRQCVAWKGKRGSFEANNETRMFFFGEVSSVTASAPSKEKLRDVVERSSHSVLDMWKAQQARLRNPCSLSELLSMQLGGRNSFRVLLRARFVWQPQGLNVIWRLATPMFMRRMRHAIPSCAFDVGVCSVNDTRQRWSGRAALTDEAVLHAAAMAFQASGPSELLVGAAVKDFTALLQAAPRNPQTLWRTASGPRLLLQSLAASVACVKGVLKNSAACFTAHAEPPVHGRPVQTLAAQDWPTLARMRSGGGICGYKAPRYSGRACAFVFFLVLVGRLGQSFPQASRKFGWASSLRLGTEWACSVAVEEKLGGARCLWLQDGTQEQTEKTKLILGAVYPEHGGDIAAFSERRILIMGDCKFHTSAFLAHNGLCRCAHCSPTVPLNPPVAAHVSGTAIDLVLGRGGMPLPVAVLPERAWADALATIDQCLGAAADALELATTEMSDAYSAGAPTGRRRAVLNAAAWLRDTLFSGWAPNLGSWGPGGLDRPRGMSGLTGATAATRYARLCLTDPPGAARFMAMYFRRQKQFTIALVDAEGASLDGPGMIAAVVDNLHSRVGIDSRRRDSAEERAQAELVGLIRAARAPRSGVPGIGPRGSSTTGGGAERYSAEEMATARATTKGVKLVFGAPRITLAAVNIGRACHLTAAEWSLRRFMPLRKCGPLMVRNADNLRPISLSTDVAAAQDALWLLRCRAVLEQFAGPEQVGGKSDVQSMLLAIVSHAQLRMRHGMPTYWVFADLRWAFELMTLDCLRLTCYEAGVVEDDWALVDEMLAQDRQCVQLLHYLSHTFALGRGAARGRKWSVHVVSSNMRWLRGDILNASLPARSQLPFFAQDVLQATEAKRPAGTGGNAGRPTMSTRGRRADPPWRRAEVLAAQLLSGMDTKSARIQVLELMGSDPIGPLQLVDDATAICPSAGAAAAVVLIGCANFARRSHATFNFGPSKTAVMPLGQSPGVTEQEMGCPVVTTYRNLGVLLDANLSFEPRLTELCRLAAALCGEVLQTARAGCFPLQAQAAQIPVRFDRAEGCWVAVRMGVPCGWTVRLGTLFLEQVLVAQARARVLPVSHPLARMLTVADNSLALTWARAAKHLLQSQKWTEPIPDICDSPAFAPEELSAARRCLVVRRGVMRRYRCEVLRPILQEHDRTALAAVASVVVPGIRVAYERFQYGFLREALGSYPEPQLPLPAKFLQAWALVRISGKWPAVLWNGRSLLETLPRFPGCAHTDNLCPAAGHCGMRRWLPPCLRGHASFGRPHKRRACGAQVSADHLPGKGLVAASLAACRRGALVQGTRLDVQLASPPPLNLGPSNAARQLCGIALVEACAAQVAEALGPNGATTEWRLLLQRVGLAAAAAQRVGSMTSGERRRLAVACAIAGEGDRLGRRPRALLADEPTTGLDAFQAMRVVTLLRELAVTRSCVAIATLHQPRAAIWRMLDDVLLLSPGGHVVYCGPASDVLPYFQGLGHSCMLEGMNPAEFLIDLVSVDTEDPASLAADRKRIASLAASFRGRLATSSSGAKA